MLPRHAPPRNAAASREKFPLPPRQARGHAPPGSPSPSRSPAGSYKKCDHILFDVMSAVKRQDAYRDPTMRSQSCTEAAVCRSVAVSARGPRSPMSRATLYRLFEPVGGVTDYIRTRRLRAAFDMLTNDGKRTVGEVAYACGFPDISTFSRAFRHQFGMSPSEVRDIGDRGPRALTAT
ncbi:MAG: AraC family transcriptional regulator, partial [Shinella sp.]|nr:AraC family transcriptional regulator [Shinella sp.]